MIRVRVLALCYAILASNLVGQNPIAPSGSLLPAQNQTISVIDFGSDLTNKPKPAFSAIETRHPDIFILLGDAVFSDETKQAPDLPGLQSAYQDLAKDPAFTTFRASVPMLVTWDDHDFGMNDGGGDFVYKRISQQLFDHFWGLEARRNGREGVYDSYMFGPRDRRVQVILLDTRYDRSRLSRLSKETGDGHYTPTTDAAAHMLSEQQWQWLGEELRKPADVRVIVSSIQVLADAHHWERWGNFPLEEAKLFKTIRDAHANGVVIVSGDRVLGALYDKEGILDYPVYELTTCSLNLPWKELSHQDESPEMSDGQIGKMYPHPNFGDLQIDWQRRFITMSLRDEKGNVVRNQQISLDSLKSH